MLLIRMHKSLASVVLSVAIAVSGCGNKSAGTVATNPEKPVPATGSVAGSDSMPTAGSAVAAPAPKAPGFDNRTARDGTLVAVDGATVQLASVWSKKPTVVVFYRGFF